MKKLIIFVSILFSIFTPADEFIEVKQKDWIEYFPEIERHPLFYEPEYDKVSLSYITPHIKWAKPYYKGKLKVLFIAPRACQRDIVELAERIELNFESFSCFNMMSIYGSTETRCNTPVGFTEKERIMLLNKLLEKKYDVIIIGQMFWNAFPPDIQNKILSKIKEGTGLLISFSHSQK